MLVTAAITASDLVLSYGSTTAVGRSSFEIPRGALTAVIGPNGSGKSTVLGGIAGLVVPAAGTVTIQGDARVAYVLQATKVNEALPITVREVVGMARYPSLGTFQRLQARDRQIVEAAMEDLDITDIAGRHLHELSGGQRQRVFLAQGIAQDHDILLLDEPLTGLDITSAQAIDAVIHHATGDGCTVVLTTHDLTSARTADHVLLMSGRVVATGPPEEVLTPENLREAYGHSLMHLDTTNGELFIDDPAHIPVSGRHVHRERTIHVEGAESERHGG